MSCKSSSTITGYEKTNIIFGDKRYLEFNKYTTLNKNDNCKNIAFRLQLHNELIKEDLYRNTSTNMDIYQNQKHERLKLEDTLMHGAFKDQLSKKII